MQEIDFAGNLKNGQSRRFDHSNQFGNIVCYELDRALVLKNEAGVRQVKPI